MNLHLTAAEWERIAAAGSGVLFRPGIEIGGDECGADEDEPDTFPPAEFVAAAQPCETCRGSQLKVDASLAGFPGVGRCDCLDGKRRVAVVVPAIDGPGTYGPTTSGTVEVGHVVVTWGPLVVVDGPSNYDPAGRNYGWMVTADCDGKLRVGDDWDGWTVVALPPDVDPQSLVGKYAIGVEVAS